MRGFVTLLIVLWCVVPVRAQEDTRVDRSEVEAVARAEQVGQVARIAQYVAQGVLDSTGTMTPEKEALIIRVTQQLIQDTDLMRAEQQRYRSKQEERRELIQKIVLNGAKGLAIVVALLVLRAIVRSIGRSVADRGPDRPMGVLITTRTEDEALTLSRTLVDESLASGGTVTSSVQSIYQVEEGVRAVPEALVMVKTTNGQLSDLVKRAEELSGGVPEIVALPRSIVGG